MPPRPAVVSIRSGFCPRCYKGFGVSERVPGDDPRIDQEQRECSIALGGLPLINLASEGRVCSEPCRLVCLVCGNTMALPCEKEFLQAREVLERHEEELEETRCEVIEGMRGFESMGERMLADVETRLQKSLHRLGMAMHPRWRRLVHSGCIRRLECGCQISRGVRECGKHKAEIVPPRKVREKPPSPKKLEVPEIKPRIITQTPVVMRKATWLKPLSETVTVTLPAHHKSDVGQKLKPKSLIKKQDPRLAQAAAGSARIDDWIQSTTSKPDEDVVPRKDTPFDRAKFEKEFDPYLHGNYIENGERVYRFPDGTKQLIPDGVVTMTDDGFFISASGERSTVITRVSGTGQAVKKARQGEKKAHQKLKTAAKGCTRLDVNWSGRNVTDTKKEH